MKTLFITLCTVIFVNIPAQEIKNYTLRTKANVFEVNVLSSNILIEGYDGNEIQVKEIVENTDTKNQGFYLDTKDHKDSILLFYNSKSSKEKEKRRKGLKPLKKDSDFNNQTILKEEGKKAVLTNTSSNEKNFYQTMFIDLKKSRFEIKVPNTMKIVVKKNKNVSPFILGKDTLFKIKNFKGEIELTSLNQDIILENISNSTLVNTLLGDIEARFNRLKKDAVVSLISTNGFVDVSIPSKENITFDLESLSGEILTNLDLTAKDEQNIKMMPQKYKADYNGGGKIIQLKTTAGDIYIRRE
ncbi:MAG: DUF4097 family beta strand repeat-containing protein [Flavobacteriales bacterium]